MQLQSVTATVNLIKASDISLRTDICLRRRRRVYDDAVVWMSLYCMDSYDSHRQAWQWNDLL